MVGLTTRSSTLRVIVVYQLFLVSHDTIKKKPFFFCRWKSCSHMTRCRSTSLGFNSYGNQFRCFWVIPNAFKHFKTVVWSQLLIILQVHLVPDMSLHEVYLQFIFKLFQCVRPLFIFNIKIIILNHLNQWFSNFFLPPHLHRRTKMPMPLSSNERQNDGNVKCHKNWLILQWQTVWRV